MTLSVLFAVLLSTDLDFLKIKNTKTAQVGTDKIKPKRIDATRHAKNPPIAKPILCLIAPQIAGTAPTIAPLMIEPIIAPKTNSFMMMFPPKTKSAPTEVSAPKNTNPDCCHTN